jgi:hypothetical protein
MKKILLLCLIQLSFMKLVNAQTATSFIKTNYTKEISFIKMDTIHNSQSTIIEYSDFLVVIELPFIDEGANKASNLTQDIPKAEAYLNYLKTEYKKPVKYVLSSHWHLHSLSGITPFFKEGAVLIAAKSNWEYSVKNGLLGTEDAQALTSKVVQVTNDTMLLAKSKFPIQVLFLDKTYTHKPTKDYLFFYFPKNKTIHASCMCALNTIDFKARPEFIYNDRVTDLEKAIQTRSLAVENLIKLSAEYDKEKKAFKLPVFTNAYFSEFKQHGKPMESLVKTYSNYELSFLKNNTDSILHNLLINKVSPQILNSAVYDCMKQKEFLKAVKWAQILNLYQPGEPNFIDTLGEAYYFSGDLDMAKYYNNLLTTLNPKNPNPIKSWEQNKLNSN